MTMETQKSLSKVEPNHKLTFGGERLIRMLDVLEVERDIGNACVLVDNQAVQLRYSSSAENQIQ
jgi:hypothetical protein